METVGLDSFPLTSETFSNITGESNLKLTSHGPFLLQCLPHNKISIGVTFIVVITIVAHKSSYPKVSFSK